jgi:YidC/Oxa1 family membrane protein insertase
MWHTLLYQPLLNGLIFFYQIFGNLGWAIIVMTTLLRTALLPLTWPSLKMTQKMKEIAPEIAKLKKKHAKDKKAFAQAQLEVYRQHGVNPAAGCLPQIIQLVVLIAFFQAFNQILRGNGDIISKLNEVLYPALQFPEGSQINTLFLYLDLTKPDVFKLGKISIPGLFLISAAAFQFLSSRLMSPALAKSEEAAGKTPGEADDMAVTMQKQTTFLLPLMTILIGFSFPSGLVLYMLVFSVTTLIQQKSVNRLSRKRS